MELFTLGVGQLHRGRRPGGGPGADRLGGRPGTPAAAAFDARRARRRHQDDPRRDRRLRRRRAASTCCSRQPANRRVPGRPAVVPVRAPATPIPADTLDRLVAAYGPGRDVTALLRALFTDPAFRGHRRPAGQAAGGVARRRAAPARPRPPPRAGRRRPAAAARRAGRRSGQVPFAAAERRRLAGRRGLADHVVDAGPADARRALAAAARPATWPRPRPAAPPARGSTRWPGCWSSTPGPTATRPR